MYDALLSVLQSGSAENENDPLQSRIFRVIKTRLCRAYAPAALPAMPNTSNFPEAQDILAIINQQFEQAKKPFSRSMLSLHGSIISRLANIYLSAPVSQEQYDSIANVKAPVKSNSKKSASKKTKAVEVAAVVNADEVLEKVKNIRIGELNAVYEAVLDLYFTSRRSNLNQQFFSQIVLNSVHMSWNSLPKLIQYAEDSPTIYLRTEAIELFKDTIRNRNKVSNHEKTIQSVKSSFETMTANVTKYLEEQGGADEEDKPESKDDKKKDAKKNTKQQQQKESTQSKKYPAKAVKAFKKALRLVTQQFGGLVQ